MTDPDASLRRPDEEVASISSATASSICSSRTATMMAFASPSADGSDPLEVAIDECRRE